MSLCMSSAHKAPRVARFLASRSSPIPLWTKSPTRVRCRWNSSNSEAKVRIPSSKLRGRGWATWKVLGLAATTAILAHVLATNEGKSRRVKDREYSNPEKYLEPQYANIKGMEAVSLPRDKFKLYIYKKLK